MTKTQRERHRHPERFCALCHTRLPVTGKAACGNHRCLSYGRSVEEVKALAEVSAEVSGPDGVGAMRVSRKD